MGIGLALIKCPEREEYSILESSHSVAVPGESDNVVHKEWERPKPGRRPDIFPQFSPMKTPIPPPLPYDPPEEDEEEEEEKKKEEEEDPEKEEEPDNPEKK